MTVTRILGAICVCALLCACSAVPKETTIALPPAPPPGEPAGVAGMEAQSLRVAFGPPAFVRKDGASEMWRYDNPQCRAFFFLYPNGASLAVRHVETVPRGHDIAADATCLDQLRAHAGAPVS